MCFELCPRISCCGNKLFRFCYGNAAASPNCYRFEFLAAHDSSHSAASRCPVFVADNSGKKYLVFTSRPYTGDLCICVNIIVNNVCGFMGCFTPKITCIPEFNLVIIDVQIHRLFGYSLENYTVITGIFYFRSKRTAGVCRANSSSQRRFSYYFIAACACCKSSRQGTGHKDQFVIRSQRFYFWINFIAENFGCKTPCTDKCMSIGGI